MEEYFLLLLGCYLAEKRSSIPVTTVGSPKIFYKCSPPYNSLMFRKLQVIVVCNIGLKFVTVYAEIGHSEIIITSIKIIKNEVGCRDDAVPKTVDTRRHCKEE